MLTIEELSQKIKIREGRKHYKDNESKFQYSLTVKYIRKMLKNGNSIC